MSMSDYLDRIGAGLVIEHTEYFSFDYIPSELVGRDNEITNLASMMRGVFENNSSGRAIITGRVGSGKTAMTRRFCTDVEKKFAEKKSIKAIHINCRNVTTKPQVFQHLIKTFDERHPDRGLGSGELLRSIRRLMRNENTHFIVVLDEVDHLLRRSGDDVLYQLLRIDEGEKTQGTLSLILISQENVLNVLESAVISRFGRSNHLRLAPDNVEGLYTIAKQRAELALVPGSYSDEILQLIAESSSSNGDARLAIELLEASAKRCENAGRKEITIKDVNAVSSTQPQVMVDGAAIETLPLHSMIAFLAICRRLNKANQIVTGDVEKLYRVVCEEYEVKPRGHTTLWKYLKMMVKCNFIMSRYTALEGGRGRTQYFSMPHALPSDVAKRLELLIPAIIRNNSKK